MEPIAVEIRAQILPACDAGEGTRVVAVRFNVSESWVRRVKQQRRETGQMAPKTAPPQEAKWKEWADWLIAKITAQPDIYLRELQALLLAQRNVDVCLTTICNACHALELTRKKTLVASEQERPDVAERREQWRATQDQVAPEKLVFIDET